jgi:hypothetical protein
VTVCENNNEIVVFFLKQGIPRTGARKVAVALSWFWLYSV